MNFKTQAEKDKAIVDQQKVVDNAKPEASKDAKNELAEIKSAQVTG